MSLINKILKDIEKQHQKEKPNHAVEKENTVLEGVSAVKTQSHFPWKITILLMVIVILLAALVYSFWPLNLTIKKKKVPQVTKQINQLTPTQTKKINAIESSELKVQAVKIIPVTLNKVSIDTQNNKTIVSFNLSKQIHYYVEHYHTKNIQLISITLANTTVIHKKIPSLANTMIQSIVFKKLHQNTQIILKVLPSTKIQSLQFNDQTTQLQLILSYPPNIQSAMQKKEVPLTDEQKMQAGYNQAISFVQSNQPNLAIQKLQQLLQKFPNYIPARELLATLLIQNSQSQKAKKILIIGLRQNISYYPFAKLLAHILLNQGRISSALHVLNQSAPNIKEDPNYYGLMASLNIKKRRFITAAQIYRQLINLQPDTAIWWVGLGACLESLGQNNTAVEAYHHALISSGLKPSVRMYIEQKINQ